MNRFKEGYVCVRNSFNPHQVNKINLSPEVVDGIVFWTKNPAPMLSKLDALRECMYYFQFTVTSYGPDVERNIPSKGKVIIPVFQQLSDKIGPERVIWRYDPIFLNRTYTVEYHIRYFEKLAKQLSGYTRKCVFSFLDGYRSIESSMAPLVPWVSPLKDQELLAKNMAEIAHSYSLSLETCAEDIDLQRYGIEKGRCIDGDLLGQLIQCPLDVQRSKGQRAECGCAESLDIGAYGTCRNSCRYCYAAHSWDRTCDSVERHNPISPLLMGEIGPEDRITERKIFSCRDAQIRLSL